MWIRLLLFTAALAVSFASLARGTYQQPEDFLQDTFAGKVPQPQVVWLRGELKTEVEKLLGHRYPSLRVRYWAQGNRSAWILEEVGKDLPITTGIVVDNGRIERIKVLTFRESRGWEIRYPFFTDQFKDAALSGDYQLDHRIDNISGATLSVRALIKQARLALLLHQHIGNNSVPP
ncbi:MAG: FMN-binding protein [Gammaproteobacteria bacterium]